MTEKAYPPTRKELLDALRQLTRDFPRIAFDHPRWARTHDQLTALLKRCPEPR